MSGVTLDLANSVLCSMYESGALIESIRKARNFNMIVSTLITEADFRWLASVCCRISDRVWRKTTGRLRAAAQK